MECDICRRSQRDGYITGFTCSGIDTVAECKRPVYRQSGTVARLDPANQDTVELFFRMLPFMDKGTGGWDMPAMNEIFKQYSVSETQRRCLTDRIIIMIGAITRARQKE